MDLVELLAIVASRRGDHERAARLVGAADAARSAIAMTYRFADQQRWVDNATTTGAGAAWNGWITDGHRLSLPDALAYAGRGRGSRRRPTIGWDSLTPTETDVVDLVAQGLTNQQIAQRLLISIATVKTHLSHVFNKLNVSTRTELAAVLQRRAHNDRSP